MPSLVASQKYLFYSLATLALHLLAGNACLAGPTIKLGQQVEEEKRVPAKSIEHSAWHKLLQEYVDAQGLVDYRSWKAHKQDLQVLRSYLDHLSSAKFSNDTSQSVKLAFWINAYNAVTIHGILREYPTSSIRNHTARVFGYNIWKDLQLLVDGSAYSLDHIEHKILRPSGEPRIHFAVVCASISCPRLLNEAYLPEKLDQQLDANGKNFFANKRNFRWDNQKKTIAISKIIDWYGTDFGKNTAEQLHRMATLMPPEAQKLARSGSAQVSYLKYDWNLNDQASSKK